MARAINKLSARKVETIKEPGRHSDGGGLYLVVDASGARRWVFLYRWQGKLKEMGLGGTASCSLAEARGKAAEARKLVASGKNPIEVKKAAKQAAADLTTFGAFAETLIRDIEAGFRNEKHRGQWRSTLKTYAAPLAGKPLDGITTEDVLACLKPIWTTKAETASRVRGRIERVLDAAKAKGLRSGENPARWRGHLDHLLARRQRLQRGHHAAMPYAEVPAFVSKVRQEEGIAPLALEFAILNACRTSEVIGARWDEIDLKTKVWTVPAARMKAGLEHRVPLCGRSLEILASLQEAKTGDYVFPGGKPKRPLSTMAMAMLLRRMKIEGATVHGFRSSFRDWAGETTSFPRELAEMSLAHVVGDESERAYRRGDLLERRRKLMTAWAAYVGSSATDGSKVIPLRRRGAG